MDKNSLGDRMKEYEAIESQRRFMKLLPIVCRIDGKNFSKFTRDLDKPFDARFQSMMQDTTKWIMEREGNVLFGYVQSDEITLVWYSNDHQKQIIFDGRIQKMTSVLAAMATAKFNQLCRERLPDKSDALPVFDCRVWSLPSLTEAVNCIIWRQDDALKNSVSSLAQSVFSHKQLQGKTGIEMRDMLMEKGIDWMAYSNHSRIGTCFQRTRKSVPFSSQELENLPEKHKARINPSLEVERNIVRVLTEEMMPSLKACTNREGVVFLGETPVISLELNLPDDWNNPLSDWD